MTSKLLHFVSGVIEFHEEHSIRSLISDFCDDDIRECSLRSCSANDLQFEQSGQIRSDRSRGIEQTLELARIEGKEGKAEMEGKGGKLKGEKVVIGSTVCLLILPAYMIPGDILRYFTKPYLDKIQSMRILRHVGTRHDKYLAIIDLDSEKSAREIIRDFDGQLLSTLEEI